LGGQTIGGGIAGVATTAEAEGIMIYNDRSNYSEWEFLFDYTKQRLPPNPNAGTVGTPVSTMAGGGSGPGGSGPGGFGPGSFVSGVIGGGGGGGVGGGFGGVGSRPAGTSAGSTAPGAPGYRLGQSGQSGGSQFGSVPDVGQTVPNSGGVVRSGTGKQ
jgi:hypothetical protein